MKKLLTGLAALTLSGMVLAGSVTIEGAKLNTIGGNDQTNANFTLSETVNNTFSVHTQVSTSQTDNTNAVSSRLEAGGTATVPLYGPINGYAKVALGQKYSTSGQFTYWSIEPGVTMPLSSSLTAKVGYRYRTAAENPNVNKDTTDTVRVGVSYAIDKVRSVGVRYDRITGDSRQDGYNVFYSHSF
jgi:opacity protein-like surface antigen